jgi:uncharacterized protein YbjT (DUF2867 family)
MKVLVAGASGLVGREVVALLKQRGHYVRTLSKDPQRAAGLRALVDDVRLLDATDESALAGTCSEIEVLVSALGAPVSPSGAGRRSFADVDLRANLNLLAEARRAGVRRFVYLGVYTEPVYANTAYVAAHTQVETAVVASGLEHGFVRTTGIFGALAELLAMARKGPVPLLGDGSATTNPVDERDVAEALVQVVEAAESREVELGGPEALTRRQIAEAAFTALGQPPRFVRLPIWLMRLIGLGYGLFNRRMGQLLQFVILASTHACVAPRTGTRRLGDHFRARALGPD